MEDEELSRGKGEMLLYLVRVALFLSGAALLLQLVFLGWLVVSPETVPAFAGIIAPAGGSATADGRLINVAQDAVSCMGLVLALIFFSRAIAGAVARRQNAERNGNKTEPRLSTEERGSIRAAAWILLLTEPIACAIKIALAFLLGVGGATLSPSFASVLAAIILLWTARDE